MEREMQSLARTVSGTMRQCGVTLRFVEQDNQQVARLYIPAEPRPLIIQARVALPGEVGAVFGKKGKFRKAAKKVAKKVAHSKVLKKMAKVIGPLAAVVPGLQPVAAGMAAATAAAKIAKAAKRGHPKAKKFAAQAANHLNAKVKAVAKIHAAAKTAARPNRAYPAPLASFQPATAADVDAELTSSDDTSESDSYQVTAPDGTESEVSL